MPDQIYPIGARLRAFYIRSGLSMRELAKRAGYKQASSIQRYLEVDYDPTRLDYDVAVKLADALAGLGDPPIDPEEILSMSGLPPANAIPFKFQNGSNSQPQNRDIPVYGTALGAPSSFEGIAVEQTNLDVGETVTFFTRPAALAGRDKVYGLFVQGSSMAPRFSDGEGLVVDGSKRPPMIGDDVVVYLVAPVDESQETTAVLLKRLVRRNSDFIELEQFNPPLTFKVEAQRVSKIHRVIPWSEMLS